jgi:hypothetical protein
MRSINYVFIIHTATANAAWWNAALIQTEPNNNNHHHSWQENQYKAQKLEDLDKYLPSLKHFVV